MMKVGLKYRIYEVSHGLLLRPKNYLRGGAMYNDHSSKEEAFKDIETNSSHAACLILPITYSYFSSDK